MVWVRIDDHYDQHPKILQIGPLGVALWIAGLAYCNRNLTDGYIPWAAARSLVSWEYLDPPNGDGQRRVVTVGVTSGHERDDTTADYVIGLLTACGLWDEISGGYQVHDYQDFQPLKSQVLREREHSRKRQEKWRNAVNNAVSNAVNNGDVTVAPVPGKRRIKYTCPTEEQLDGFDVFWKVYPRKVAKKAAQKAWSDLCPDKELRAIIQESLALQFERDFRHRDPSKIPHAATWINGRRWEDDLTTPQPDDLFAKLERKTHTKA